MRTLQRWSDREIMMTGQIMNKKIRKKRRNNHVLGIEMVVKNQGVSSTFGTKPAPMP